MKDSSSFIYQTSWKDGKHCHLLDFTWTESHSFGISAPTFPKILFSVLRAGWGGDGIHITGMAGMAEDVNGKPEVLLECIWMQDLPERSTPRPLCSFKPGTLSFLLTPLCPCNAPPFSISPAPISLYVQLAAPQRLSPSSKWSSNPHMLCSAHFPTPQRRSLDAKIKMRKGWRERGRWGRKIKKVR